jgi:tRNA pseudouridine(54/55) synthase
MNVCATCFSFLSSKKGAFDNNDEYLKSISCSVCLGVYNKGFAESLRAAVEHAIQPYTTEIGNKFSFRASAPTLILPGDLLYRYQLAARSMPCGSGSAVSEFCQRLKAHAKDTLTKCLLAIEEDFEESDSAYPPCVKEEEQGYLGIYVVALPTPGIRPFHHFPSTSGRQRNRKRRLDEDSQGGDPRVNLDKKLISQGKVVWSTNHALDSSLLPDASIDNKMLLENLDTNVSLEFHVAVWRRPFYLKGMYTKNRRDVSQTPFHVMDDGKKRKLGITSVGEQIISVVSRRCGGISDRNNDSTLANVVFGMCKFHASGREDIDVRMLLPEFDEAMTNNSAEITGRPFVCEVTDALQLPSVAILGDIVKEINQSKTDRASADARWYGSNPLGVGIASAFCFAPSSVFKNLQAETEDRLKYYGCLCRSKDVLPSSAEELMDQLGIFPKQLNQRTPIRVLHRRANIVRIRHVVSCRVLIIDDHYFRLHISTDAGTYVKEFVHGDLGRTEPSVASLLGCPTDILDLDCEGIQGSKLA